MKEITCGGCGIVYGMPLARYEELKKTGERFFCPNGCSRAFTGIDDRVDAIQLKLMEARRENRYKASVIEGLKMKSGEISRLKKIIIKMEPATRRATRTKLTNDAFCGTDWQ